MRASRRRIGGRRAVGSIVAAVVLLAGVAGCGASGSESGPETNGRLAASMPPPSLELLRRAQTAGPPVRDATKIRRSESAFARQDGRQVLATLGKAVPGFSRPAWSSLRGMRNVRVRRYLSSRSALVTVGRKLAMVSSALPLVVQPRGDTRSRPVPLSTQLRADRLGTVRPSASLSDYAISTGAGESSRLVGQSSVWFSRARFGLAPSSVGPEADVTVTDDKAVITNVGRDTDLLLSTLPGGVDAQYVLRSASSPQRVGLDVRGDDVELRRSLDRGIEAVQVLRRGEVVGVLQSPVAHDSDGRVVPVTWQIRGGRMDTCRSNIPAGSTRCRSSSIPTLPMTSATGSAGRPLTSTAGPTAARRSSPT